MSSKEEFLSKSERTKCWASRDCFWECLRSNNDKAEKCSDLRRTYELSCPVQWVNQCSKILKLTQIKCNLFCAIPTYILVV